MITVSGSGLFLSLWAPFQGTFVIGASSDTSFTITNGSTVTVTGTNFVYQNVPGPGGVTLVALTGGTITGVTISGSTGQQTYSGLQVSGAAAFSALSNNNQSAFNNLFVGGDVTYTWSGPATGGLTGLGGNDTFNISNWGTSNYTSIDGGGGFDTINITGGVSSAVPHFNIINVERINLGAGSDYALRAPYYVVTAGNSLTIDGSTLGASNHFSFGSDNANSGVPAGNLTLLGGAGDDFFQGGSGTNIFSGGGGSNTVSFYYGSAGNHTGVTADLSNHGPQSVGGQFGGTYTLLGIQNVIGTLWNDTLTGDANDNIFDGGGGNDVINGGLGTDTAIFHFASSGYTITPSNGSVLVSGSEGTATLTGVEYALFADQTIALFGPKVTTSNRSATRNQTFSLSSLLSVVDLSGNAITEYQLWDSTTDPLSGSFVVNGVAQAAHTVIDITAAQLSQTSFVTGKVSDNLQIRVFDGTYWSAADNAVWAPFTVTVPDAAPSVSTSTQTKQHLHTYALSSLFSVSDADGDAITQYQLWDGTRDPNSGHFEINGVAQAAATVITISASQLAQTTFVTGSVSDSLELRASDGIVWSAADNAPWAPFTISIPANSLPQVSTASQRVSAAQTLALSSLFSVVDGDSDTMTRYQLWDSTSDPNSGHFVVNGQVQAASTVIDITAAQLGQTSFVTGTVNDSLQIRAFDGIGWSAADTASWAPFTIGPLVNNAPVVTTSNRTIARSVTTPLSGLISVNDADGDAMTEYQLWDGSRDPNSGHFTVNGVAQAAGTVIDISAAQLSQTSFVTGSFGDSLQIRAFDGISWSAADTAVWSPFTVSVPDAAPVVTTSNVSKAHLQSYALSSLFSVSDADGDAMTKYQLWDSSRDPNSGHFVVNGQAQAAGTVIDITAAQLAQTSFFTGTVGDTLQIRAFDGISWSAADNASWAPFTLTVPANNAPALSTGPQSAMHGRTLALSSLFSVTDADGDAMTKYQLWDSSRDPLSGHFVVNGVAQAAGTVIDITAAQLSQTSFVTGQVSDNLQLRAFDGINWSDADNASWAPFTVSVTPYTSPTLNTNDVNTTPGQTLALSSLFSVTDTDGDTMTRYQLWDSTRDPNSGNWVVNGVVQAPGTVIDITASQLAQTSFLTGSSGITDGLQIRAFDGVNWSAADNAAWNPFHINVS